MYHTLTTQECDNETFLFGKLKARQRKSAVVGISHLHGSNNLKAIQFSIQRVLTFLVSLYIRERNKLTGVYGRVEIE